MEALSNKNSQTKAKEAYQDDFFQDKAYNSGIRALLSIRNFSGVLEKDYVQLTTLEKELDKANRLAFSIIETHAPVELQQNWNANLATVNANVVGMNTILHTAGEKVSHDTETDSADLWKQFNLHLETLKKGYTELKNYGVQILPETEHLLWNNEVFNAETAAFPKVIAHAELCRLKLQMLEKYTPAELTSINKMILDHIPADFNFEESYNYQKKYLEALVDFTKDLQSKKNLWDKFLDVLAGGTNQPPSEHVMMEKWLEGEKGDLL